MTSVERLDTESPPLVADRPSAYIPGDRRRALAAGIELPSRVRGAALFADISGFTPLTEGLANELGSQHASEVLTGHLNRVFHAVIAELDRYGGDVIYFSGDAITCWLDGDDGTRAIAAGCAMHDAIAREGLIATPGGRSFQLGLKVAIAVGPARRFVVGDPEIQLIDVLAGSLIDTLAEAEHSAEQGEVVLDRATAASLQGRVELRATRGADGVVAVERLTAEVEAPPPPPPEDTLPEELARPWLLPAVYDRLSTGRGEFLAELRPAFPIFVNFGGIDYDADESATEKLDEFVRAAQRILDRYGGNVLQLTLGDKGAYLYGVFGTPLAHEDDAARACAAALEVVGLEHSTAARAIRVGITYGRLRSGTYGHAERRTFVCLGDAVNLAARLMAMARPEEIYVSDLVRRLAGGGFTWDTLPPLQLKGKAGDVVAHLLRSGGGVRSRRVARYALPIVGRGDDLTYLDTALAEAAGGNGRIVGITAEAGMGKSRLLAEFVRETRRQGVLVAFGECQSFGNTSYAVWREIWRTLLAVPDDLDDAEQVRILEEALAGIDPRFVQRAPLLDTILGLSIPDNELTSSFDAKLRKTSLESLLTDCLRGRARREPLALVIVIEDAHWLDGLSRDLLEAIARAVQSEAVLLVLAYRPEAAEPPLALAGLAGIDERGLAPLEDGEMADVVRAKLGELAGRDVRSASSLIDLVVGRAQGNAFYAEELLNFVAEQKIDPADEDALRSLELPVSLHSLVLSRIDTLAEEPRRTLKVASVVGRVFRAPVLPGSYPELGSLDDVRGHLDTLQRLDLVKRDREEDESYLFKHAVTREVAYESLPYALRRVLHGHVGRFIEEHEPDAIERNLDLLAYHFGRSDDDTRRRTYLLRAGERAQALYANSAAIEYYRQVVPMLEGEARVDVLLKLGKTLEVAGGWDAAERAYDEGLELARGTAKAAWCETAAGELLRKRGRYDEASTLFDSARTTFADTGDLAGVAQVLHYAGTLAAQQGDNALARARYRQSLELRRELDDRLGIAATLNNLGILAEYERDFAAAAELHREAHAYHEELGDRRGAATSLNNLGVALLLDGQAAEAAPLLERAVALQREVGDPAMVANFLCNSGNAARALRDFAAARARYDESLALSRELGDRWLISYLLEDVAVLAARTSEPARALRLAAAGERLRQEIGAPRPDGSRQELDEAVESARRALPAGEADAAWSAGAALELEAAIAEALGHA